MSNNDWQPYRDAILSKLIWQDVYGDIKGQQNGNGEWVKGCCPFHEDTKPSFAFSKDTLAFSCFAGCGKGSVIDYLTKKDGRDIKDVLIELGDSFGIGRPGHKKQIVATYDYVGTDGDLLHQTVRYEPKSFSQRRKVGGKWVWSLKGVITTLYNLPDVARAEEVIVLEGEKDCDNVKKHYGLVATTCPMGAGKWRGHHSKLLKDKNVLIVPDNDGPGSKHATGVAKLLSGTAQDVKIVSLPGEHNGRKIKDISDYIESSATKDDFLKLVSVTKYFNDEEEAHDRNTSDKINELNIAIEMIYRHRIIYSEAGKFYKYTGGYYREISENDLINIISDERGCLKGNTINLVIRYIKAKSKVMPTDLNNDRYLNLENGLFDIEKYELVPHSPDVYSTIRLGVTYDKGAECPRWVEAVDTIIEDEENINITQEFFGLCMTKETYDRALFITGEGSNGKSTLLEVLKGILGDENTCEVQLEQLDKSHYVAQLHGKLLNLASEIGAKGTVCDDMFKKIVAHDTVMGDHKFGHPFSFRPVSKLIFAANNMPRTDDKSRAFYRRLLVVPLAKEFKGNEARHKYHRTLLEERSGIFNWMVDGLKRLVERGRFEVGEKMAAAISDYKIENNPIIGFIEENCAIELDARVAKRIIYNKYKDYCDESGFRAMNIKKFGKELQRSDNGISETVIKDNGQTSKVWSGIRIKEVYEVDENRPY